MAAKTKKGQQRKKPTTSKGGALTGMRSGMKRMTGQGPKKKRKKKPASFNQVLGWVIGFALLLVLIWALTR